MCFQKSMDLTKSEMSVQQIHRIIDQTPCYSLITFTGGEPLIRKDIRAVLKPALKRNHCNMVTNGTLLTEPIIELLVLNRLTLLGVSIDGIGVVHDGIRNKKGAFDASISALRLLQQCKTRRGSKLPLVDIKTTILPQNVHQLSQIHELAREVGADFYTLSSQFNGDQFNPVMVDDLVEEAPASSIAKIDTHQLRQQIERLKATNATPALRSYPDALLSDPVRYYRSETNLSDYQPCKLPWSQVFISPYGEVYPCLPYKIGDITDGCLGAIWNNERMRHFRHRLRTRRLLPACAGCCYMKLKETDKAVL
jgi:radical SAM protein with 4Fe4S-binding SPASM domain